MSWKSVAIAGTVAITAFLVAGIAVTALLEPRIEFSMLVGLPAGLFAGVLAGAGMLHWLADDDRQKQVIGATVAWFSFGFLGSMAVLLFGWNGGVTFATGLAVVIGILVAALVYFRQTWGGLQKDPLKS